MGIIGMPVATGKIKEAAGIFKKDIVFTASLVLAVSSCFVAVPKLAYIDFGVLACLFNIMIVVKAFEELHMLDKLSVGILSRCSNSRRVSLVLILMSFFLSMVFTNDVALLTLVPLALLIGKKSGIDMTRAVIFQTLAANIGSSLTPMGNPQNLYIYSYFNLNTWQFFSVIGIFAVCGLIWLLMLNRGSSDQQLEVSLKQVELGDKRAAIIWGIVFISIIFSVFRLIHYGIAFAAVVICAAVMNRKLFLKADYRLLLTFICFFIFIGNLSNIPTVRELMKGLVNSSSATYFGSILLSQVISNVPCAILLSGFTSHWKELLLGVNIGGMGTIIASLASVISYKFYSCENPQSTGKYIKKFTFYNVIGVMTFTGLNYLLLRFAL